VSIKENLDTAIISDIVLFVIPRVSLQFRFRYFGAVSECEKSSAMTSDNMTPSGLKTALVDGNEKSWEEVRQS
jgi:hypothetical protein